VSNYRWPGPSSLNGNKSSPFALFKTQEDLTLVFVSFAFKNVSLVSFYLSQNKDQRFVFLRFTDGSTGKSRLLVKKSWLMTAPHHNFLFKPTTCQIYIRRWHHFAGIFGALLGGLSWLQQKIISFQWEN
jgi:hypothetical protein